MLLVFGSSANPRITPSPKIWRDPRPCCSAGSNAQSASRARRFVPGPLRLRWHRREQERREDPYDAFSLVEVGRTTLQLASDGTSAIVHVETNPPTVCAIAYGKTASLGSIADDPNMGGTAISVHTVVLGGLSPGTTYRFRLTASDAKGTVFLQNPKPGEAPRPRAWPATAPLDQDVAIGAKVVAVSSQWSSAYKAANAVDGNLSTEWASNDDGDRAFIAIDLGRPRHITGLAFISREMSDGRRSGGRLP